MHAKVTITVSYDKKASASLTVSEVKNALQKKAEEFIRSGGMEPVIELANDTVLRIEKEDIKIEVEKFAEFSISALSDEDLSKLSEATGQEKQARAEQKYMTGRLPNLNASEKEMLENETEISTLTISALQTKNVKLMRLYKNRTGVSVLEAAAVIRGEHFRLALLKEADKNDS